jgi:hypothetical protein
VRRWGQPPSHWHHRHAAGTGEGRGPEGKRPFELRTGRALACRAGNCGRTAGVCSAHGEAAPHTALSRLRESARHIHARAHAAARFRLSRALPQLYFNKAVGTGPSGRWKASCVWTWARSRRLKAGRRRPAGAQTMNTAPSTRRARGFSYSR